MAKKEVKEKAPVDQQNGVTRPKEGTTSAEIWAILDALPEGERTSKHVSASLPEANKATINTQTARWRAYHGLTVPRAPKDADVDVDADEDE